jgi:predicted O-methyltransferase YrrM
VPRRFDDVLVRSRTGVLRLSWVRRAGWLADQFGNRLTRPPHAPQEKLIEQRARQTDSSVGVVAAATVYEQVKRRPNQVRTSNMMGRFFADLVSRQRPDVVVEFGAAFGVSGMYFTAALEDARVGRLHSFEINPEWAAVATRNLETVGPARYNLTVGAFEDHVSALPPIDLALIDAVHTREWVLPQFDLVAAACRPGALVLFDDIDFSDEMRAVWAEVAADQRVVGSVSVAGHVGVVELR